MRLSCTDCLTLTNKELVTVKKIVPVEVVKTIDVQKQAVGANFAIVTDPKNPNEKFDFNKLKAMSADTTVNLNQYNVFAYKKLKTLEAAISDHTQSLGLDSNQGGVYFNRGTTYLQTNDLFLALKDIIIGFRLRPFYGLRLFAPIAIGVLFILAGYLFSLLK